MELDKFVVILFFGSTIVNLLHWHGDERGYYSFIDGAAWPVRIAFSLAWAALSGLWLVHAVSAGVVGLVVLGYYGVEQVYSIWRRHVVRGSGHGSPSN